MWRGSLLSGPHGSWASEPWLEMEERQRRELKMIVFVLRASGCSEKQKSARVVVRLRRAVERVVAQRWLVTAVAPTDSGGKRLLYMACQACHIPSLVEFTQKKSIQWYTTGYRIKSRLDRRSRITSVE